MVGIQFLCNFGITGIGPILPLYIKDMLGGGSEIIATIVGIIIFLAGGASALCSLSTRGGNGPRFSAAAFDSGDRFCGTDFYHAVYDDKRVGAWFLPCRYRNRHGVHHACGQYAHRTGGAQ